jgi:Cu-processing system ATP-binding protein
MMTGAGRDERPPAPAAEEGPNQSPEAVARGLPVRFAGLRKRYGPLEVLRGVDARFEPGRVSAILGPNGAGKTTLLKCLLGLVRPDEGHVEVGDARVNGEAAYRRDIGYMPQLPRFPGNLSGHDLVALLADLRGFDGVPDEELIERLGLSDELAKPFRNLSGGTRQKVNAALAFRFRAPVLVLDEPTAGLDPVASRTLKEKVRRERDLGRTVLLTSHDLGQVEALADDILFLLDGRVRYRGSLESLLSATGHADLEGAVAELLLHPLLEVVP